MGEHLSPEMTSEISPSLTKFHLITFRLLNLHTHTKTRIKNVSNMVDLQSRWQASPRWFKLGVRFGIPNQRPYTHIAHIPEYSVRQMSKFCVKLIELPVVGALFTLEYPGIPLCIGSKPPCAAHPTYKWLICSPTIYKSSHKICKM